MSGRYDATNGQLCDREHLGGAVSGQGGSVGKPYRMISASLAMLERIGAQRGPLVDLRTSVSEKPAQFFFLERGEM